ncbi:unnamed protein product, partial [Mesorhabditis belari]|uniref:Uncharacterized protein n=1 Tax=Mesorhabditis belari TaxID=2138241 RepID=A0A915GLS8_9BILA
MMWLWRPTLVPSRMPDESDYNCCCQRITARTGFTIFIGIDAFFLILSIVSIFMETHYKFGYISHVIVTIFMVSLACLSIKTFKPAYLQVYGICYIIQFALSALIALIICFVFGIGAIFFASVTPRSGDEQHIKAAGTLVSLALVFGTALYMFLMTWKAVVTYKYYRYIRDRQLAIEEQPALRNTNYPTTFHP